MFIPRAITPCIENALKHFPVVLLTGPRQTGKTELLKHLFADYAYFSLDALDTRGLAQKDPRSFFATGTRGIIIDEIQEAPELLSYVKEAVDRHRQPGCVILTGSQQFHLMKGVTESLAGRVAVLNLLPFSYAERKFAGEEDLASLLLQGMYPAVQTLPDLNLELWFSSYLTTYVERDLRSQIAIRDLRAFETLLQLLASRVGQELNIHRLATEIGINAMTAKAWIAALEAAYIIYLLPPYFQNFGKRLIKSPKLYFVDTGLVCYLTRLTSREVVLAGPLAGPLFENFVVSEMLKHYYFQAKVPPLYFWRSHDGLEVDIVVERGDGLDAIECKLSHTATDRHVENLAKFAQIATKPIRQMILVSQSQAPALSSSFTHCHWAEIADCIFTPT